MFSLKSIALLHLFLPHQHLPKCCLALLHDTPHISSKDARHLHPHADGCQGDCSRYYSISTCTSTPQLSAHTSASTNKCTHSLRLCPLALDSRNLCNRVYPNHTAPATNKMMHICSTNPSPPSGPVILRPRYSSALPSPDICPACISFACSDARSFVAAAAPSSFTSLPAVPASAVMAPVAAAAPPAAAAVGPRVPGYSSLMAAALTHSRVCCSVRPCRSVQLQQQSTARCAGAAVAQGSRMVDNRQEMAARRLSSSATTRAACGGNSLLNDATAGWASRHANQPLTLLAKKAVAVTKSQQLTA